MIQRSQLNVPTVLYKLRLAIHCNVVHKRDLAVWMTVGVINFSPRKIHFARAMFLLLMASELNVSLRRSVMWIFNSHVIGDDWP